MKTILVILSSLITTAAFAVAVYSPPATAATQYLPVYQVTASDLLQIRALYLEKMAREWDPNAFCEASGIEVALRLELVAQTSELEVFSTSIVTCKNQNIRVKWDSCLIRYTQNGPDLEYCDNGLAD